MPAEVDMHLQEAVTLYLVQSATEEVRIGDQRIDTGEPLEKLEKRRRVELGEHLSREIAEERVAFRCELLGGRLLEFLPRHVTRVRKLLDHAVEHPLRQEVVEHDVRKRLGRLEALAVRLGERHERLG